MSKFFRAAFPDLGERLAFAGVCLWACVWLMAWSAMP